LTKLPPLLSVDLASQPVVVTGSNIGLGYEAAKQFAKMGTKHLILAVQSKAKSEAVIAGTSLANLSSEWDCVEARCIQS
jgi:NAD(P)-dependent dehydrogenase (short-subunit alcohol dehydrogenase family)